MKAMILAAGLGTRLRPLSFIRPKVLTPLWGMTMLEYWMGRLAREGVEAVIVNAFHLSEPLVDGVKSRSWPIPVEVSLERELLGTGGGIRYALDFFGGECFLVINGDILCSMDLAAFYADHLDSGTLVSLVMHDCPEFNNVAVSQSGRILEFGKEARALAARSNDARLLAFTGIHCVRPEAFESLDIGKPGDILDVYRRLIARGEPPRAYLPASLVWREMGSLASYAVLHKELAVQPPDAYPPLVTGGAVRIHASSVVAEDVALSGYVVVGEGCRVGAGTVLEDVVLWDGVDVAEGSSLTRCIVGDGARVSGRHQDEVLVA
ncbi:MAG: sugar phosphate nucleotidyltransferase [Syntrophobacteraceae bacterium]